MDDRAFFDALFQLWAKTTHAEDGYWEPARYGEEWAVWSVAKDHRQLIAVGLSERDAEFVAGVHGVLPDVVRLVRAALDEADRLDARFDEQQHLLARRKD